MQLAELQAKTDQELFDFALEEELVEEGPLPKRMDIFEDDFQQDSRDRNHLVYLIE